MIIMERKTLLDTNEKRRFKFFVSFYIRILSIK